MIWVDLKANDGQDISKDLFVLLMRQANKVPKLEKSGEIGRVEIRFLLPQIAKSIAQILDIV